MTGLPRKAAGRAKARWAWTGLACLLAAGLKQHGQGWVYSHDWHDHYLVGRFKLGDGNGYPGADHLSGWWYGRNLRIFANLLQLARAPDDRILFIVGAGHVPILRHAALSAPDFELVDVADALAASTPDEMAPTRPPSDR